MKNLYFTIIAAVIILFGTGITAVAQSIANYTPTRATGITYTSISSIGNSISSWRHNDPSQMLDDNRSNPIPIGFDFWYDGARYTTLSVGINGVADFSSSAATGFTSGDYDSDNFDGTNPQIRMTSLSGYTTRNALAVLYGDLTTQNIVDPLGNSFKYLTTGTAPNRVMTVEWINLSYYSQYKGESYNFQLKLYESTGVIEFLYGNNTAGTGTPLKYKTGMNAPSFTALSSAVVMIQQNANSTYFLPQPVPAWGGGYWGGYNDTLPTVNSKLIFTPLTPANPTNLTFPAVDQTSMTLNWTDNASNEVGYAIYSSLDGLNYTYTAQVAKDSNSYTAMGLFPETMYYWKVYAVTEGGLSADLNGSQATTGATSFTSQQSGSWNTGATWGVSGVPTANSNVTIATGHTVTIDGDITVNNITVATGGILLIGNDNTARTLNISGNIIVNAGAQFTINTGSNTSNHAMNITGNILNDNIFDLAADADSRCQITFNRAGNQTLSGTGTTTRFYLMNLNMGSTNSNVLDITTSNFLTQSAGFLTITNGTFKYGAPSAITPFTATTTVPLTGGVWVNNSSAVVTTTGGDLSVSGFVRVTNGVLNVGTAADQQLLSNGGDIVIEGGAVNVAGSFNRTNNVTITRFTMTGGALRVAAIGSTSTTLAPFLMDISGSSFTMSGGGIVVVSEGGTGANDLGYVNTGTTTYSITGGTLQIGDYTTPAGQIMQINTNIPVFNFTDSSANATAQLVASMVVNNNLLIAAGTLNANNLNISVGKNWTNQATFIPGTGTVTFIGLTGSILTKATGEIFNNLTINKSSNDVSLGGAVTVNGTLNFASAHNILLGTHILTLNGSVSGTPAAGKCIVTNGTGAVSRNIAAGNFTFPVGSDAAHYNPVKIANNGTALTYTARVTAGTTPSGSANTNNTCGQTWTLTGTTADTVAFSWNTSEAGVTLQFDPSASSTWRNAADWVEQGGLTVVGTPNVTTVNSVTTFPSAWIIGTSGVLPIELTSFTAVLQGTSALLKWTTAAETNNSGFQIERSIEGSTVWVEVAFINGAGTSSSPKTYSCEDKNLAPGAYVYRMKQIDNDGKFKYYTANMPKVDAGVSNTLQLGGNYPNPFNPTTNMQFSVPQDGYASLKVYNMLGQEVATLFSGIATAGHFIPVTFNASRLASGIYFSRLQYNGKSLVHRMLLTK